MNYNQSEHKYVISEGYTLIELILSVVLVGILASTMVPFISSTSLTFDQIRTRKELISENTLGLELVSQDLSVIYNLISTSTKSVQFTTTIDTNITIEYKINNDGSLQRKSGFGSYQPITINLDYDNSQFTYYDIEGNIGSPVHRIRMNLLFSSNGINKPLTMDIVPYTFR